MNFLLCFGNFFRNSGRLGQNHGYLPSVRPINVWPRPQSPPRSSQTLWDDLLFLLALLPHWRIFIYCVVYVLCPIYIFSLEAYSLSTFGLRPSLHLARPPPRRLLPVPYCAANTLNQILLLKKKMKVIFQNRKKCFYRNPTIICHCHSFSSSLHLLSLFFKWLVDVGVRVCGRW